MDPEKRRQSLSLSKDDSAPGPSAFSALRTSTRSPSFRRFQSLRKSRSSSVSTADSISIHSTHSTESHFNSQSSCVTRDIPHDECAFYRFMVWVAVKRNESVRMTPGDRLQCPLLHCRKRFVNHELMLRHLYTCDALESGEYWCYDCDRSERFTDAKCKRCLGHPTKRRKMLSMAKNFFTTLGHKSRKDTLLKPLPEDDALHPPPSYDSLDLQLANELCSTVEIHEIDSREVDPNAPAPTPPFVSPAELDTRMSLADPHESSVASWINDPMAYVPSEASDSRHSMEERRMKTRSKTLAPSSSLRSNASNSSTNTANTSTSTDSTDSTNTVSTGISSSAWSDPWTAISGMDTDLESPISNLLCPSRFDGKDMSMGLYDNAFDGDIFMQDLISELPADLPLLGSLPTSADLDDLSFANPIAKTPESGMPVRGNAAGLSNVLDITPNLSTSAVTSPELPPPLPSFIGPSSLVETIWETLQTHTSSSESRLLPMTTNNLAAQFLLLDSRTVASYGHATLKTILLGRPPESSLHLLCYVHVAYSYFLVVHEDKAAAHSKELFAQALNYANMFAIPSRVEYLEIARAIWEPDDIGVGTVKNDVPSQSRFTDNPFLVSSPGKGKELSNRPGQSLGEGDVLLGVAQYLLDEFECAILPANAPGSLEVLSPDLWASHVVEAGFMSSADAYAALRNTIGGIVNVTSQLFSSSPDLISSLQFVNERVTKGYISTVRRVELELLQAARGYLPLAAFITQFAPFVRQQCDILYSTHATSLACRSTHYGQVIDLIESMIPSTAPTDNARKLPATSDLSEFLYTLDTPFPSDNGNISPTHTSLAQTVSPTASPSSSSSSSSSNGASGSTMSPGQPSPQIDRQDGPSSNASPAHSERSDAEGRATAEKVEADVCCELCGYRPTGHPQWFKGSMMKHKKHMHSAAPPQIFQCPFPGCTSRYKNRQDNLRQHQLEKGHFVDGEEVSRRPSKRKKI
ncbi:uncharacterized protein DNG_02489 [Cephalotrichum gorgonifer]|uniref:Uncharacterized protein n=1 Tax=Cephalotrichum gorgonifer TaxID=2041049 RepID=A0AAE8SSL9_9PEZI|nr:uncharacterized protein DNG_02489 [Cephalotrichum gorgonifer]